VIASLTYADLPIWQDIAIAALLILPIAFCAIVLYHEHRERRHP